MDQTELVFTFDKKRLHKFFTKDPALFAFHIGDLDDFYFKDCQWAVCYGERPFIQETVLIYYGLSIPCVLALGLTDRFGSLMEALLGVLPPKFYAHFQGETGEIFRRQYNETPLGTHMRMRLTTTDFLEKYRQPDESIVRLDQSHQGELLELYERSYPGNYFDEHMLASGKYLGCLENGRIVAVAGVHVDSTEYEISLLGNVTTDPEYRGRGLGTKLTGALTAELADERKLVCLNVALDNAPAIKIYERLGFEKVHEYEEGLFTI